jgi:hypothetical protein
MARENELGQKKTTRPQTDQPQPVSPSGPHNNQKPLQGILTYPVDDPQPVLPGTAGTPYQGSALGEYLAYLTEGLCDGTLRINHDISGKTLYAKYRWTRGTWANHYVLVVGVAGSFESSLSLLCSKVAAVRNGFSRPSRDEWRG